MLEVTELRSGYGRLEILQGVSLSVAPATIVGVIGPNGAGKSTLLKTVFGYLSPFGGHISLERQSLVGLRPDQIVRLGAGFVAQAGGLFADMTVHENLLLGGYGLSSRRELAKAVDAAYDRFPRLADRRRQPAASLSGGEQRALALARALVTRPRLLLLDEPSAALAPRFIDEVYAAIQTLNRSGLALLIVEQNVEMILSVAHRVFVLDLGRNAFDGTPPELRETDRIRRLYLGETRRESHAG
jgi:branched-chain amino acid transport system ATP-binding protein